MQYLSVIKIVQTSQYVHIFLNTFLLWTILCRETMDWPFCTISDHRFICWDGVFLGSLRTKVSGGWKNWVWISALGVSYSFSLFYGVSLRIWWNSTKHFQCLAHNKDPSNLFHLPLLNFILFLYESYATDILCTDEEVFRAVKFQSSTKDTDLSGSKTF